MDLHSLQCPRCGAYNQFDLVMDKEQYLRRCSDCEGWFIAHEAPEDPEDDYRMEALSDPPTCPVDGCEETIPPEQLPPHIIEHHDATLTP